MMASFGVVSYSYKFLANGTNRRKTVSLGVATGALLTKPSLSLACSLFSTLIRLVRPACINKST